MTRHVPTLRALGQDRPVGALLFDLDGTLIAAPDAISDAPDHARVRAGVPAALQALSALGLRLAVVTHRRTDEAIALLQRLGLSAWVELVIGSGTDHRHEPGPLRARSACEALHAEPAQTLFVGRADGDIEAARAAGLPAARVASLTELVDLLLGSRAARPPRGAAHPSSPNLSVRSL